MSTPPHEKPDHFLPITQVTPRGEKLNPDREARKEQLEPVEMAGTNELGIQHAERVIDEVGSLIKHGLSIAQGGVNLGDVPEFIASAVDIVDLAKNVADGVKECGDLTPDEAQALGLRLWNVVRECIPG